ncbi:hypothetical protein Tco_0911150 [Tanacetum coccineum]|uniref:Uncharacterized protein n=1 Tax=Tanacetum coccineum TaxID=301880 RepID=A0ABQ5CUZ4_9ASTR
MEGDCHSGISVEIPRTPLENTPHKAISNVVDCVHRSYGLLSRCGGILKFGPNWDVMAPANTMDILNLHKIYS